MSEPTSIEKTASENNGNENEQQQHDDVSNVQANTVTMADVLNQQLELEHEATYELQENWGDEEKCTFNLGYITQPVYACDTCSKSSGNWFGFCFGCSMNCHLEHDVFELFKKRGFRCDCGTPRSNCKCELHDGVHSRDQDNVRNIYNHNFVGKYCWCDNPYDHNGDISMIQCVVCEDWFHNECIINEIEKCRKVNTTTEFATVSLPEEPDPKYSLVCGDCVKKYPFLAKYPHLTEFHTFPTPTSTESTENNNNQTNTTTEHNSDTKTSENNGNDSTENQKCKIEDAQVPPEVSSLFFSSGWRTKLCTCRTCSNMYRELGVYYLLEETDDPENEEEGEEIGNENNVDNNVNIDNSNNNNNIDNSNNSIDANTLHPSTSLYRSAEQAFLGGAEKKRPLSTSQQVPERISTGMVSTSSTSRGLESVPQRLEMAMAYSEMSNELREYLRKFATEGKVVTENDIVQFFETLKGSKKRRKD
eukprot:TRINITY_DN3569_c0_g1_i1.p1 TRINITY_DN3569_c0_g1~~TRINITY_DN3569_c0_g1_i1.p1  ORF type:complete len:525 (-),score=122.73 TRINITY_DN3569_c0_g1_i1:303-1730(-)